MIRVFAEIMSQGTGNASVLAGGISEALITTAAGLTVAIPALAMHRYFIGKIDAIVVELEQEDDQTGRCLAQRREHGRQPLKFRRQRLDDVSVNLTPLIDVVFLLLIFFMVSTTFTRETQLSVDLPEAQGQLKENNEEEIEILIDEGGAYRVNGQGLVDRRMRTLQAAIYKISAGDTTMPMIITADAQAAHEDVVRAMDAAGQMGFVHLSITTRQPTEGHADG